MKYDISQKDNEIRSQHTPPARSLINKLVASNFGRLTNPDSLAALDPARRALANALPRAAAPRGKRPEAQLGV